MPRKRANAHPPGQGELLDVTAALRTGPCVPALREAVKAWRAGGYKGITETTRTLLNFWFETDHRLAAGKQFKYHASQREAIESLIFVWEYEKVRTRRALLERYAQNTPDLRLPMFDDFARYCIKMATGSGKTKVMALAIAWQFLNAAREKEEVALDYAKTALVVAPNVIVLERLKSDFAGAVIFRRDPVIPKELEIFWDFNCLVRGDGEIANSECMLFLTNIQQLYERDAPDSDEPDAMTGVLGSKPPAKKLEVADFEDRIALRAGNLLVVNDEAHHTHDEENEWNKTIRRLHGKTALAAQLDFSATPRFQKGGIFPWTISDYPLKQAIVDGIVKRPMKGVAKIKEAHSDHASVRYRGYLAAGVERWREYKRELAPLKRKPVLFVMMNSTEEADDVADWLRTAYPEEFAGKDKALVIHTDVKGEVSKKELDAAREAVRQVDGPNSPINAIVSVLMLREGWDVQNVTVVVGLRPYKAKANILPEQTIGRGLRLMFRDLLTEYTERVDIIGNDAFLNFVDDLEKLEDFKLGEFELGKDRLHIVTILPEPGRAQFDISIPDLAPTLVRKKSLAEEIAGLDVMALETVKLPLGAGEEADPKKFVYQGYDIITLKKLIEREYAVPEPQTAQEVIGYYARRIAEAVKLPAQFAALAPKVREFFELNAFGQPVDLNDPATVRAMNTGVACFVCVEVFKKALSALTIEEQEPKLLQPARPLSTCPPFPWSRKVWEGRKTVFNLVPCDNDFEHDFARFLDGEDSGVTAFAKLPMPFGFAIEYTDAAMNLRSYYPDWAAIAEDGTHWLFETKGQENTDVHFKDAAAGRWCSNATELTNIRWRYLKVPQKEFEALRPSTLRDLSVLAGTPDTLGAGI